MRRVHERILILPVIAMMLMTCLTNEGQTAPGDCLRISLAEDSPTAVISCQALAAELEMVLQPPLGHRSPIFKTGLEQGYSWGPPSLYEGLIAMINRHIGPLAARKILELGSGANHLLKALNHLQVQVHGLERTGELVKRGQEIGLSVTHGDILEPPAEMIHSAPFDAVVSAFVVNLLDIDDIRTQGFAPLSSQLRAIRSSMQLTSMGGWGFHLIYGPFDPTDEDLLLIGAQVIEKELVPWGKDHSRRGTLIALQRVPSLIDQSELVLYMVYEEVTQLFLRAFQSLPKNAKSLEHFQRALEPAQNVFFNFVVAIHSMLMLLSVDLSDFTRYAILFRYEDTTSGLSRILRKLIIDAAEISGLRVDPSDAVDPRIHDWVTLEGIAIDPGAASFLMEYKHRMAIAIAGEYKPKISRAIGVQLRNKATQEFPFETKIYSEFVQKRNQILSTLPVSKVSDETHSIHPDNSKQSA